MLQQQKRLDSAFLHVQQLGRAVRHVLGKQNQQRDRGKNVP